MLQLIALHGRVSVKTGVNWPSTHMCCTCTLKPDSCPTPVSYAFPSHRFANGPKCFVQALRWLALCTRCMNLCRCVADRLERRTKYGRVDTPTLCRYHDARRARWQLAHTEDAAEATVGVGDCAQMPTTVPDVLPAGILGVDPFAFPAMKLGYHVYVCVIQTAWSHC